MKKFLSKSRRIFSNTKGFSLLELIVVIAIMGFLVAMMAPRLAGVVTGATRNTDLTNMSRIAQVTAVFNESTGRLPNNLTNIVIRTDEGEFAVPPVSNNDATDGKEALSLNLAERIPLRLHYLTTGEAAELRNLGITTVRNLNLSTDVDPDYNDHGIMNLGSFNEEQNVEAGVAVLMVAAGAGIDGTWAHVFGDIGTPIANPDLAYRIVLGVGLDNELVTTGQIQNTAISPSGSISDQYVYNNYLLILPRLESTIVNINDLPATFVEVTDRTTGEIREVEITNAQDASALVVVSPEGVVNPPEAGRNWEITASDF